MILKGTKVLTPNALGFLIPTVKNASYIHLSEKSKKALFITPHCKTNQTSTHSNYYNEVWGFNENKNL